MKCLLDREHFKRAIFALLIVIHGNRWFWLCFSAKIRMSNGIAKRCNIPLYFMNDGRLWKRLFAIAYHNLITFILICRTFEFPPAWENGAYLLNETVSAPVNHHMWSLETEKLWDPLPIYGYIYISLISILQNVWRKDIPT